MTIGLSNSAARARNLGVLVNRPQGGGDKKAGFPYQVGRSWWSSIYIDGTDPVYGHCADLKCLNRTLVFTNLSRPVGSWTNGNTYWALPVK